MFIYNRLDPDFRFILSEVSDTGSSTSSRVRREKTWCKVFLPSILGSVIFRLTDKNHDVKVILPNPSLKRQYQPLKSLHGTVSIENK